MRILYLSKANIDIILIGEHIGENIITTILLYYVYIIYLCLIYYNIITIITIILYSYTILSLLLLLLCWLFINNIR